MMFSFTELVWVEIVGQEREVDWGKGEEEENGFGMVQEWLPFGFSKGS
jgi:hypothetical protein